MTEWASGDTLTPSTLNRRLASASTTAGFSTNTLNPESGATSRLSAGFLLLSPLTVGGSNLAHVGLTTSVGADTGGLTLTGGGWAGQLSPRGAFLELLGDNHTNGGQAALAPGVGGEAHIYKLAGADYGLTVRSAGTVRIWTRGTPTGTSAGSAGDLSWDTDYFYMATSTNSWGRIAWSRF